MQPDGSAIAFVRGGNSIWMKTPEAADTSLHVVVPASQLLTNIHALTFSPDGAYLVFIAESQPGVPIVMYVNMTGGISQTLYMYGTTPVAVSWYHPLPGRFELLVVSKQVLSVDTEYTVSHFSAGYYETAPPPPTTLFTTMNQPITAVAYNDDTSQVACAIAGTLFVGTVNEGASPAITQNAGFPALNGVQSVTWLPYSTGVGVCATLPGDGATSALIVQPNANPALLANAQHLGDLDLTVPLAGGAHVIVQ